MQKRVLAINDISCVGRCSLTVALPVISVMGIETSVLPTAILSTHTGGFTDFTFRDLTDDLLPIVRHWDSLDITFAGMYSGYLGSHQQIAIVQEMMRAKKTADTLIFIDPVMGDLGKLYQNFDMAFVEQMKGFCQRADVLVPNITEACLLLDRPYKQPPYTKNDIEELIRGLAEFGPEVICLTGVQFNNSEIGAAVYQKQTGKTMYVFNEKIPGDFHGTGDLFASILFGAIMREQTLANATQLAVDYTMKSIKLTAQKATFDRRFGVEFEPFLWQLGRDVDTLTKKE